MKRVKKRKRRVRISKIYQGREAAEFLATLSGSHENFFHIPHDEKIRVEIHDNENKGKLKVTFLKTGKSYDFPLDPKIINSECRKSVDMPMKRQPIAASGIEPPFVILMTIPIYGGELEVEAYVEDITVKDMRTGEITNCDDVPTFLENWKKKCCPAADGDFIRKLATTDDLSRLISLALRQPFMKSPHPSVTKSFKANAHHHINLIFRQEKTVGMKSVSFWTTVVTAWVRDREEPVLFSLDCIEDVLLDLPDIPATEGSS